MYVDTHCHLVSDALRDELPALLERARAAGVGRIINIAYDPETVELALQQVAAHPEMLVAALGIQPHDATTFTPEVAASIESEAARNPRVVAIGEIGLDDVHKLSPRETQESCFEHFLEVALRVGLPVVVHVRETHAAVRERLTSFAKRGGSGVIHCFTGTRAEGRDFLDIGFYLSFSGIVTFRNADELREVAREIPAERILVETDSPYLAPIPHRGKRNEPGWTSVTGDFVAGLRGVPTEEFAALTTNNARTLFSRLQRLDTP